MKTPRSCYRNHANRKSVQHQLATMLNTVVNVLSTGKKRRRDEFLSDQELDDGMCFRLP